MNVTLAGAGFLLYGSIYQKIVARQRTGLNMTYRKARLIKYFVLIFLFLLLMDAQAEISRNKALVVGNSQYLYTTYLPNPESDAQAISTRLEQLGFDVTLLLNIQSGELEPALQDLHNSLTENSVALFFYAGHGLRKGSSNYLIPTDSDIRQESDIERRGIDLSLVLDNLSSSPSRLNVVMLDACRNNPFQSQWSGIARSTIHVQQGLAAIEQIQKATILSYATEPGSIAVDGRGRHSPYTQALLKYLDQPGLTVEAMFSEVGRDVFRNTHGGQKPWFSSSTSPRFCFAGCGNTTITSSVTDGRQSLDRDFAKIMQALQTRDLEQLKSLASISDEQARALNGIFSAYPVLDLATPIESRQTSQSQSRSITVEIQKARNHQGNLVIPSADWNRIRLELPRREHALN